MKIIDIDGDFKCIHGRKLFGYLFGGTLKKWKRWGILALETCSDLGLTFFVLDIRENKEHFHWAQLQLEGL